eukprot:Skav220273  [mRNA]  locus=scaffold3532:84393:87756:- [translate_table: standard]
MLVTSDCQASLCREALKEENGDLEKDSGGKRAVDWLKKRGVRSMEKRSAESAEAPVSQAAALLALGIGREAGAIVELRAETDFVTRSELFQQALRHLAQMMAAAPGDAAGNEAALHMEIRDGPDRPSSEA